MTGRDLIIYILENGLENEPIYKDGSIIGLMSIGQAAEKWNVGKETVRTWTVMGMIDYVMIDTVIYIPATSAPKFKEPEPQ